MLRHPLVAAKLFLATVAMLVGFSLVFLMLAHGMKVPVSVPHVLLFMPLIFFVSSLPFSTRAGAVAKRSWSRRSEARDK